jgi:hypothetical protein
VNLYLFKWPEKPKTLIKNQQFNLLIFFSSHIYSYIIYLLWQIISEFWHYFQKSCPLGLYVILLPLPTIGMLWWVTVLTYINIISIWTYFHFLKVYTKHAKHGLYTWYIWSIHIGLLYNHVLWVQILDFRKHQNKSDVWYLSIIKKKSN